MTRHEIPNASESEERCHLAYVSERIPDFDAENYRTSIDRQMLYVGGTRAMHLLRLTHTSEPSRSLAI